MTICHDEFSIQHFFYQFQALIYFDIVCSQGQDIDVVVFAGSVHLVSIQADHFATNPADKVTSADTWGFSVP